MLQKETVRKWKSQRSLKNNPDQQGFLKIHVLHLSQPVLVPYLCTHLFLHLIKQITYHILYNLKLSLMTPGYGCLQTIFFKFHFYCKIASVSTHR